MPGHFHIINESNKLSLNKPSDADLVYYSELREWYTTNAFRSFSMKYVIDRCIYYKVGREEHAVHEGQFLLACKQPYVQAYFNAPAATRSICIDICPNTVAEAFTIMTSRGDVEFDNYLAGYFSYPEFFETVCHKGNTAFALKLDRLVAAIQSGEADEHVDKEWFLDLVEKIICHEYGHYLALSRLTAAKTSTRKELLRRLAAAKTFIDEQYLQLEDIGQVASFAHLSLFHFFRSFKQAYGLSPYRYLLQKRLELARTLLAGPMSITEIALHCSFPDIFSFSKAFKKNYGLSPDAFRRIVCA